MRRRDVQEFTESINARTAQLGLPSSSSTPCRSQARRNDDTFDSSFEIIGDFPEANDSDCAVQISVVSQLERSRIAKQIAAAKSKKALESVLSKNKSRNERLNLTLDKYRSPHDGEGDFEPFEDLNGHSFLTEDEVGFSSFSHGKKDDPMHHTIVLDDTEPISFNRDSVQLVDTTKIPEEGEDIQSSSSTSLRTETHYHTPRPKSSQQTPLAQALNNSLSHQRLRHAVQEQLAIKSPFASRSPPLVEEVDLTTPERSFRSFHCQPEVPPATAKYKENEGKLDRVLSAEYLSNLVETTVDQSILETSRVEKEFKMREERRKTDDLERQFREVAIEPPPSEPFIEQFYKGITGIVISDDEEEEEEEEEVEEELLPSEEKLDEFIEQHVNKASYATELINKFNIPITRKDLDTLNGLKWLNDEVINFYFNLIQERSKEIDNYPKVYVFNTYFSSKLAGHPNGVSGAYGMVRRWTKAVDIFDNDILLIPITSKFIGL